MANRRMFAKEITNSSDFQMMSPSAQALYLHIGMNSDDDGFCEVFTIMRMTESKPDDLRALHERGFIYIVDSKVCIVKDWHTNNHIQSDRYVKSKYLDDPKYGDIYKTIMAEKVANLSRYSKCIQGVSKVDTQVRLGKVRLVKNTDTMSPDADTTFDQFYNAYPKKELKKKSLAIWKREKLSKHLPEILVFIEKAKHTDRWKKNYIKQPPVFLNNECWNDDLSTYEDRKEKGLEITRIN